MDVEVIIKSLCNVVCVEALVVAILGNGQGHQSSNHAKDCLDFT